MVNKQSLGCLWGPSQRQPFVRKSYFLNLRLLLFSIVFIFTSFSQASPSLTTSDQSFTLSALLTFTAREELWDREIKGLIFSQLSLSLFLSLSFLSLITKYPSPFMVSCLHLNIACQKRSAQIVLNLRNSLAKKKCRNICCSWMKKQTIRTIFLIYF